MTVATNLRLAPLPDSPDPLVVDSTWPALLPAGVAVVDAASGEDHSVAPLVLLGGSRDLSLAAELTRELARTGRPAPLALLACSPGAAGDAAELDLPVIDLGVKGDATELAEPLWRELSRLAELGAEVRSFVESELLDGQANEITDMTPLLELGIVDSISIVSVIAFIEGDLGIPAPEQIHPRYLADVLSIRRLIAHLDADDRDGHHG
jgi:hypothetical protein